MQGPDAARLQRDPRLAGIKLHLCSTLLEALRAALGPQVGGARSLARTPRLLRAAMKGRRRCVVSALPSQVGTRGKRGGQQAAGGRGRGGRGAGRAGGGAMAAAAAGYSGGEDVEEQEESLYGWGGEEVEVSSVDDEGY